MTFGRCPPCARPRTLEEDKRRRCGSRGVVTLQGLDRQFNALLCRGREPECTATGRGPRRMGLRNGVKYTSASFDCGLEREQAMLVEDHNVNHLCWDYLHTVPEDPCPEERLSICTRNIQFDWKWDAGKGLCPGTQHAGPRVGRGWMSCPVLSDRGRDRGLSCTVMRAYAHITWVS